LVPVRKQTEEVRLCADFRELNKSLVRDHRQIPSFEETLSQLDGATVFSKLDAKSGYLQIPVTEGSQDLLTFSSPVGNYCFTRMPFGISTAPEVFQKCMETILQGTKCIIYMDDILVYGQTNQEHDRNLKEVVQKLKHSGLRMNRGKCEFFKENVSFLGHILSKNGVAPDPEKLSAIFRFPVPKTQSDLRSFLGLAEYAGHKFVPHFSDKTNILWSSVRGKDFFWCEKEESCFLGLKEEFRKIRDLAFFNPKAETKIQCDASGVGLGAVLLQDDMPVMYASRKLTDTEQRYSQLEKEFLAVLFACQRFRIFILGINVTIETDNKPIVSFFDKKIDSLPIRIQRWMLHLQPYQFKIKHISGKQNVLADMMSRNPDENTLSSVAENDKSLVCLILKDIPINESTIIKETEKDGNLQILRKAIEGPWKNECEIERYKPWKEELSIAENGIIMVGNRILIPSVLQKPILEQVHSGHQGSVKMKCYLRAYCIWPGMSKDIENFVNECSACLRFRKDNRAAPFRSVADEVSTPWHTVGMDFTGPSARLKGQTFLTIIDYHSRFPFAIPVRSTDSKTVITSLSNLFSIFGYPKVVISDNGPAFICHEIRNFFKRINVEHRCTSAYYPQGNGVVERFHSSMKSRLDRLLFDGKELIPSLQQVLFDIRSTPNCSMGETPFKRFFGREMRAHFSWPGESISMSPAINARRYSQRNSTRKASVKEFAIGSNVVFRKGQGTQFEWGAKVVNKLKRGAWLLQTPTGRKVVVNQSHIRQGATSEEVVEAAYDRETQLDEFQDPTNQGVPSHRYNLRPRRGQGNRR